MVAPSADDLGASGLEALAELTEAHSPRASASAEERAAAMYIAEQFKALGYTTEIVPFSVELPRTNPPVLQVDHPLAEPVGSLDAWTLPLENSGEGEATGVLRAVGKGLLDEVTPASLTGRVALIERGIITFQEKVSRVADAGAVAAVIYNNRDGAFSGRLTGPSEIPAVAVSRERGEALLELMSSGNVEATVSVVFETRESANVVAELKGADPDGSVVVLGGHYDTVPNVPGVNDNGSGIAVMLTIARQASQSTYPFTLRFIAFGSEEIGLLGSQRYVDSLSKSELADIVAMFNFDAELAHWVRAILQSWSRRHGLENCLRAWPSGENRGSSCGEARGCAEHQATTLPSRLQGYHSPSFSPTTSRASTLPRTYSNTWILGGSARRSPWRSRLSMLWPPNPGNERNIVVPAGAGGV